MKSKRGFIFNSVKLQKPKRNAFNLSYENKLTGNMGELLPFFVQDVLPHDTIKVGNEYMCKAQSLIAPMMHRVDVYQHYFFVPLRLIWDDFEKFITGGADGTETAEHPYITSAAINNYNNQYYYRRTKLLDLLGYPVFNYVDDGTTGSTLTITDEKFSSLRIRAYNLIYNEFYRDQNLEQELVINKGNGIEPSTTNMDILFRAWKKDYFTSALPFAQRGPNVTVPWTGGTIEYSPDPSKATLIVEHSNNITTPGQVVDLRGKFPVIVPGENQRGLLEDSNSNIYDIDPNGTLRVNSDFEINLNDLRRANAIQRWFEKNARAGARYVEQIMSHFGIHPSDYRLQRPLYLGGGKQPLNIGEVLQTSATDDPDVTPQGNRAGVASAANAQFVFKHTFEEHGIIIGLMSVLPKASYSQGINRLLQKFDKFDYAQPEFSNLGEQEILNKEVFGVTHVNTTNKASVQADQNRVFGYQSRYAEYKYNFDQIHGDFRHSLDFWHLGRIFSNQPNLNHEFIKCVPSKRVFAVELQTEDCLLFDIYNHCTALRCLSAYGTPAL